MKFSCCLFIAVVFIAILVSLLVSARHWASPGHPYHSQRSNDVGEDDYLHADYLTDHDFSMAGKMEEDFTGGTTSQDPETMMQYYQGDMMLSPSLVGVRIL